MADTTTTNLGLTKPEVGASADTWGNKLNTDLDLVDGVFAANGTGTSVGINVGAGKVAAVAGTLNVTGTISGGIVAPLASPTFTGVVGLPSTTSIGPVSSTELGYLDGVTSNLQTQLNDKLAITAAASTYAPLASPAFTGTPTAVTATTGTNTTQIATTAFVQQVALNNQLPLQTGNTGKYLTTDGTNANWAAITAQVYPSAGVAISTGSAWAASVAPGTSGNVLTSDGTTWTSTALPSSAVNYPQNSQSANYTLVLGDAGKQIFHPASDAVVRTYTIPANASVAFPIGTVVLFTVENGGTTVGININSDTLVYGNGTTGALAVVASQTLMAIKITSTKWLANYLYQTGTPTYFNPGSSIAFGGGSGSPYFNVYPWNSSTGFGSKYADPVSAVGDIPFGMAFNPASTVLAMATFNSPYITAYAWSGLGFGARYSNPATLPTGFARGVAFSPANDVVAVAHATTPFITAYPWSDSTGFGAKYANPATLPVTQGLDVAFNPAGDAIAVAHSGTPFISVYPWNVSTGFGTKYANPATLPGTTGQSVAFSPAGNAIAVATASTPFITAYPWSGAGFGTKYTNPATLANDARSVAFNPAATSIALAHFGGPYVTAYPWNSGTGFGTKYTNPATLPPSTVCSGVAFNAGGDSIAVSAETTPFIVAYPWDSSTGFGTKYANPATLPTATGYSVAFTTI